MTVLPLKGYKSLRALNAFHTLLLGMKMLPAYGLYSYEEFFKLFEEKNETQRETMLREAAVFVRLEPDEVEALVGFTADKNGVPYQAANVKNLGAGELHEIIVKVCMQIGRIKIDLVTPEEKKSSETSQSTSDIRS